MNFLRQDLAYFDFVRDQDLADVLIQINRVQNAGGGSTYELRFIGKGRFEGFSQTLDFSALPTDTPDAIRRGLAGRMEIGLIPYLAQTSMIDQIVLEIADSEEETVARTSPNLDPWNFWIYEIYAEADLEKESLDQQIDIEAGFSADRITESWLFRSRLEMNYFQRRFESDEQKFATFRRRNFAWAKLVRSLGPHWSAGVSGSVRHDTYDNIQLSMGFAPAVEYSLFPYDEVIQREITFSYEIEGRHFDYLEETIYEKEREYLFRQEVGVTVQFRQPWGDVFARLQGSAYLHNFARNRVELFSRINVRIWKGLAVRFSSNIDLIRDQISLPAGTASVEDILLRQRQIATDFQLEIGFGVAYTFGSAYNNIVNTRL